MVAVCWQCAVHMHCRLSLQPILHNEALNGGLALIIHIDGCGEPPQSPPPPPIKVLIIARMKMNFFFTRAHSTRRNSRSCFGLAGWAATSRRSEFSFVDLGVTYLSSTLLLTISKLRWFSFCVDLSLSVSVFFFVSFAPTAAAGTVISTDCVDRGGVGIHNFRQCSSGAKHKYLPIEHFFDRLMLWLLRMWLLEEKLTFIRATNRPSNWDHLHCGH